MPILDSIPGSNDILSGNLSAESKDLEQISIAVGNVELIGWKTVRVKKSLSTISGDFELSVDDKQLELPGSEVSAIKLLQNQVSAGPSNEGGWDEAVVLNAEAQIKIGDNIIITGYLDEIDTSYSNDSVAVTLRGRDRVCDLVDCNYDIHSKGKNQFKNMTPLQVIVSLCEPFGIDVNSSSFEVLEALSNPASIEDYTVEVYSSVFSQISDIVSEFGVLPISLGDGNITLVRAGEPESFGPISVASGVAQPSQDSSDMLKLGWNIKSGSLRLSSRSRFGKYYAMGEQKEVLGFRSLSGASMNDSISGSLGTFTDKGIVRHRPLIIKLTEGGTPKNCRIRAEWEGRVRAGKGTKVVYQTQGWLQNNGEIWSLNKYVTVDDKRFSLNNEKMLISDLEFSLNKDSGKITTITLTHPDAFQVINQDLGENDMKAAFKTLTPSEIAELRGGGVRP